MIILDEKSGEILDKDISRSECPFRSITDLKRKYHSGCEKHVKGKTRTQAEQYVPMIKMIEKMLRGEDVEFIREMLRPLDLSTVKTDQELDAILDGIIPDDIDPADVANLDLSTETRVEQAPQEPSETNSSSGEVANATQAEKEVLE